MRIYTLLQSALKTLILSAMTAGVSFTSLLAAPWQSIPTLDAQAGYTSVVHFNGKYYAFAGQGPSFWESDDGLNFTPKSGTGASGYEVKVLGDTLLVYGFNYVQYSQNAESFTQVTLSDNSIFVNDVDRDGANFYAATDSGLYVSTDSGVTWSAAAGNASIPLQFERHSAIGVVAWDGKVLIGTNGGPYLSTDGGASFSPVTTGIDAGGSTMRVGQLMRSGDTIWVTISGYRILHKASINDLSWQVVDKKFNADLLYTDTHGGIYRLASASSTIDKSIDGVNWAPIFTFGENNASIPLKFMVAGDFAYFCSRSGKHTFSEELGNLNAPGENIFHSAYDLGEGWSYSENFGFFWAGAYPWIWTPALNWTFIYGPNEKGFFAFDPGFGWFYTWKDYFPYIYVFQNDAAYTLNMSGTYPDTRAVRESDKVEVGLNEVGVLSFDFNALAGKTISFTDSIGSHSMVINSFGNDGDRADLTMKINGQTQTFSSVQLTYTNILGPRILLQAQAGMGDTTIGSQVQLNLIFDSASRGTTNYIGYSLFAIPPVTGGSGVKGTFTVQ